MSRIMLAALPLLLTCAVACATTARGTSDRVVVVDGREVSVEVVAQERYDEALALRAAGEPAKARAVLEDIRRDYADAAAGDKATVALAQLYLDDKQPRDAQLLLEGFLLEDPTSDVADQARYLLALAQLAQGDSASAAPTLKSLVDKMPTPEEKCAAALKLADELLQQGQGGEAARYLSRALDLTDEPGAHKDLEEKLFVLVDTRVPFAEVRRLKETEAKQGTFLDELLTMKLARVHVHLRDYVSAAEAARAYQQRYPQGRFASAARALAEQLASRVEVEPRTIGVVLPLTGQYAVYGQRVLTSIKLGLGLPVERGDYFQKVEQAAPDEEVPVDTEQAVAAPGTPPVEPPPPSEQAVEKDLSVAGVPQGSKLGPVNLVVRDSKNDPLLAQRIMQELVEEHHAIAVIGDILLDTSLPVALKAEEYTVPTVSLSRRDGLPELGPWVFRMAFTAEKQAEALASLAMDTMGHRRFAVLYPRHSYGLELMNAFWDEIEERQGEITAIESYGHDQTTFTVEAKSLVGRLFLEARGEYGECRAEAMAADSPYARKKGLERCKDAVTPLVDFDALLIPDDYRTVSYIVPALAAEDMLLTTDRHAVAAYEKTMTKVKRVRPIQLLGGNMWNNDELAKRLARQIDGAVFVDGFDPGDQTDKVQQFMKGFAAVHRSAPGLMEAHAFDAGHLMGAILEGTGGPAPTTRAEMRERLAEAKDFPGVTGLVRFDERGESTTPPRFFQFKRDRIEGAKLEDMKREGDG